MLGLKPAKTLFLRLRFFKTGPGTPAVILYEKVVVLFVESWLGKQLVTCHHKVRKVKPSAP